MYILVLTVIIINTRQRTLGIW